MITAKACLGAASALGLAAALAAGGGKFTSRELNSLYYADLGPEAIDVSSYPARQRAAYLAFSNKCSQCHTLARAVNSPTTSRAAWSYYVMHMRLRGRLKGSGRLSAAEKREIVDFLVFDSKERKVARRAEFDALTRRLQRRFAETITERMRRLQAHAMGRRLRPRPPSAGR